LLIAILCAGVGVDVTDPTRATRRIVLLLLDVADMIVEQSTVAWGWTVQEPIPVLLILKLFSGRPPMGAVVAGVARATSPALRRPKSFEANRAFSETEMS
jgi:hypothetical protein